MRVILLISSILLLSGCVSTTEDVTLEWPASMMQCTTPTIEVKDERIMLSYQDFVNIAICERDMFRYIKDLTTMVCLKQQEDERCKKILK